MSNYIVVNQGPNRAQRRAAFAQQCQNKKQSKVFQRMESPAKAMSTTRGYELIQKLLARRVH